MKNNQDLSINGKKEPVSEPDLPDCARIVREPLSQAELRDDRSIQ